MERRFGRVRAQVDLLCPDNEQLEAAKPAEPRHTGRMVVWSSPVVHYLGTRAGGIRLRVVAEAGSRFEWEADGPVRSRRGVERGERFRAKPEGRYVADA
jgi:hypothetical protein